MDAESNKALVKRYLEMWNTGDASQIDDILAADYVDQAHPEVTGTESVKQSLLKFRAAFPDFHISVETIVSEADQVALRVTMRRTQEGVEVISSIAWFVRIAHGKMAELHTYQQTSR